MLKAISFFLGKYFSWWAELCLKNFLNDLEPYEIKYLISQHFTLENFSFLAFIRETKLWEKNWQIFIELICQDLKERKREIPKRYQVKLNTTKPENVTLNEGEVYLYVAKESYPATFGVIIKNPVNGVLGEILLTASNLKYSTFCKLLEAYKSNEKEINDDLKAELFEGLLSNYFDLFQNLAREPLFYNDELQEILLHGLRHYEDQINRIDKINKIDREGSGIEYYTWSFSEKSFFNAICFLISNEEKLDKNIKLVEAVLISPVWKLLLTPLKIKIIRANYSRLEFHQFIIRNKDKIDLVNVLINGDSRCDDDLKGKAVDFYELQKKASGLLSHFDSADIAKLRAKWPDSFLNVEISSQQSHDSLFFNDSSQNERVEKEQKEMRCDLAQDYIDKKINVYTIFELAQTATEEEIVRRFRILILKSQYNPNQTENKERFQNISNMKEMLLDSSARRIYDNAYSKTFNNSSSVVFN